MASRKQELRVVISGDTSQLDRAFGKAGKSASQLEGHIGRTSQGIGRSMVTMGKVATAAVGVGLVGAIKGSIDAFGEAQVVAAQTEATLKSTGGAAKVTAKDIGDLATAISRKSGIDDEAIQSGENMLLTFTKVRNEAGKNNDIFNRATQTVADFSVTFKKDLAGSAILVGKALNDPIKGMGALGRVGVQFDASQKKAIETMVKSGDVLGAQKLILKELETQTKGAAEAYGNTLPGKIGKAKVALGNLGEAIGGRLAPVIATAAEGAADLIDKLVDSDRPAAFFKGLGDAASGAKDAIGGVFDSIGDKRAGGESLGAAIGSTIADGISDIDWAAIGKTIADGISGAIEVGGDVASHVQDGIGAALGQVDGRKMLAGLLRVTSEAINALFSPSFWKDNFANIFATITIAIPVAKILKIPGAGALYNFISRPFFNAITRFGKAAVSLFGDVAGSAIRGFIGALGRAGGVTGAVTRIVTTVGRALGSLPGHMKDMAGVAISALRRGIVSGAGSIGKGVGTIVSTITNTLGKAASAVFRGGWSVAKSLLNGVVSGIKAGAGAIVDALKSVIPGPLRSAVSKVTGIFRAAGGIVPGAGRGDTVPAMLEPGEFVIRRAVVEKFGPSYFANLNGGAGAQGQDAVQRFSAGGMVKQRANRVDGMHLPYLWGGGHSGTGLDKRGMDCSGAVSYALGISPRTSGGLMSYGKPGPGAVTIFANPTHTFMSINGRGWGTSRENPGGGPGWLSYNSRPGFTIRHVPGIDKDDLAGSGDPQEANESGKRTERLQREGSRSVNKISAPFFSGGGMTVSRTGFGGAKVTSNPGIRKLISGASGLAASIEQGGTLYGQAERRFDQSEEDLGTKEGREKRVSELNALKTMKAKQLDRQRRRASALKRAITKYKGLIKAINAAIKKTKGAKAAKMRERRRTYDGKLVELQAELLSLTNEIVETELDISDLDADVAEVNATPDTDPTTVEGYQSTTDKITRDLNRIDALVRAGDMTAEQGAAAKVGVFQAALKGDFGALTEDERLGLRGDLNEALNNNSGALEDNTSALTELRDEVARQNAFAESITAVTGASVVKTLADLMSDQIVGVGLQGRNSTAGAGAVSRN